METTKLERLVLLAILTNEISGATVGGDGVVWVDMVADDAGLSRGQLSGVLASLSKKERITTDGECCSIIDGTGIDELM